MRASKPGAADREVNLAPSSSLQNDVILSPEPAFEKDINPDLDAPAGSHSESRRRSRQVSRHEQANHAPPGVASPMEPGLKGLPRLSDLVAVRGAIIIETPQERALNAAMRSKMIKATSRPHEEAAPGPDLSNPPVSAGMN